MKLVTVIVPVYKVEKYLQRCIESIRNQTYKNLEIILVDDESPDNCPEICDDYAKKDSRIKVIHKEQNGGLGFARNSGFTETHGDYVTFIDSDDWISESHIENLLSEIIKNSADAVIGVHTAVDVNGKETPHPLLFDEGIYEGEDLLNKLLLPLFGTEPKDKKDIGINASSCMNLYNVKTIREHSLEFISERHAVGEDTFFNIDFFNVAKRVVAVNETGYYYFENNDSISRKYNPERFARSINYYNELKMRTEKYGLSDKMSYRIERSFLMKTRWALKLLAVSDLKRKDKNREIKRILNNSLLRGILKEYPVKSFIPSMRILITAMRLRWVFGVKFLLSARETAKKSKFMVAALKRLGIGG